ncbi:chaperonin 10-like protein [Epithele typhae]|uniref:chaperonin 10-like protein n=1 Tax=Epithele typhae TaxID=378194 RepID=UPI002008C471|nr:chaperonin 10-like protein [Epithele typhae]KAH9941175.1 chaperonin 10-like protein [Epithele typhae]
MPEGTMKALWYDSPLNFQIKEVPIPKCGDDELLLKVSLCGVCGTDGHIHEGEFIAKFPLIPGHEAIGTIVEMGKNVKDFAIGDRIVADVGISCDNCFYCRRGNAVLCENFNARGVTLDGGFAEYIAYPQRKCYKIHNLTDEESTLLEPAACAIHGLDKLNPPVGIDLLKLNGAARVTIAANKGIKMDIAKKLNAGDEPQWDQLRKDNPYGFDVVVEATGVEKVAQDSINYVRRGGTIMIYGVYENKALLHWPPSKIFGDEIRVIGSFSQAYCFPRAVAYLDGGKVNVKGMVTDVFKLDDYQGALDKMNSRGALKIAIKP